MGELQLSNNLTTIETEIKSYQNIAGQSIFEIGRRLKHVKENDLAHGEFREWHENIGLNKDFASKAMKVSEELIENVETFRHLGLTALDMIATLPEQERTVEHATSNGETKTPDEMTVKELSELKKQLKQRDEEKKQLQSQIEQVKRSENIARKQLEDEQNKEPEIVERYSEPKDYQEIKNSYSNLSNQLEHTKKEMDNLKNEKAKLKNELEQLKLGNSNELDKAKKYDKLNEEINRMNGKLDEGQKRIKAQKEVYDLVRKSNQLIKEVTPLCYLINAKDIENNDFAKEPIEEIIYNLEDIQKRLRKQINLGDVING